ncbi:beta-ketoacyl synthase N-terminal-like domain-containing protein [Streptomyces rubradiris]|nr:beta-ketoacyl synthase N-terminal-like domain-containing protein [Streptomyces rubradiris]
MTTHGIDPTAPIAVVGMSCRFPGATHPVGFWNNLMSGTDSVGTAPQGRWEQWLGDGPAVPGTPVTQGGFIDGPDTFDAGFFGVARREAEHMDPQQRLLLELAWQALEDAAVSPSTVHGAPWGVYVGACADDFRTQYLAAGRLDRFGHMGTSRSLLAGRLSHHFGLHGPSEVIDTGQSSSLCALHRAVVSLRLGECEGALVAGVNLNLLPEVTEQVRLWGGLSADGRCRTLDERADGYVRAEGGGCVVLKPLDTALRDGDHVYAVVRGSATNNDGGRCGLGVPSHDAQCEVIRAAHRTAGVTADQVAYLELHGTGTPVGDPVEARAVAAVIGRQRPQADPLRVGSVKTNIGHLESAAGIAGFIKACLAVHHGQLPPTLHHHRSPADLPLGDLNLRVIVRPEEYTFGADDVVGVSSFGMGGTNVHVVLGPPPAPGPAHGRDPVERPDAVLCLSGRSREAVRALARALLDHPLPARSPSVADVAWTLVQRAQWEHRAAVVGGDWEEIREGLHKVVAGHDLAMPAGWTQGADPGRIAAVGAASSYVCTGGIADVTRHLGPGLRKVPGLPTYPFERDTFALPRPVRTTATTAPATQPAPVPDGQDATGSLLDEWTRASTPDRLWLIRSFLERELLTVLGEAGSSPLRIDPDHTFNDLGIDSMSLLEFQERIVSATSLAIPESALFDHPTINELAAHVNTEMEAIRG